jgi:aspartate aminotransferase-like enzyme
MNLRIPGPTAVPPSVLEAMDRPMINHRGSEFSELFLGVTAQLKEFYQTKNDVLILTGAGTGAMEAAVVNTLSPKDRVLVISIGVFGDRFAKIAQAFGADVVKLDFPWGTAADPDAVESKLKADSSIKAVIVTHNETSTGVTNDLEAISQVVKRRGLLLIVDAVSAMGAIDLPTDKWNCDVVITGSQKAWMIPPGLAMVSVSPQGWEAIDRATMPRVYWDLKAAKKYLEKGQTPWTPAVSLVYALSKSLALMSEEGLANVLTRHKKIGAYTRAGLKARGLELFAQDERYASNAVTAFKVPEGLDGGELIKRLRVEHNVVVAGGQLVLSGKIVRVGHLGYVSIADIDDVFKALDAVLPRMGFTPKSDK